MKKLVEHLVAAGVLRSPRVVEAFETADRRDFVPGELASRAYDDTALPTVAGQTISQPTTVAFMLELLSARPGQKVLDVGFGSGWTTALLARIVGERGRVFALEIREEVFRFGRANLRKYDSANLSCRLGSGRDGWREAAPFDRILVSAAGADVPPDLIEQLAAAGRMVLPLGKTAYAQSIVLLEKYQSGRLRTTSFPGFVFVPLVK